MIFPSLLLAQKVVTTTNFGTMSDNKVHEIITLYNSGSSVKYTATSAFDTESYNIKWWVLSVASHRVIHLPIRYISLTVFPSQFKFDGTLIFLSLRFYGRDCYNILYTTRQLCSCGIWKQSQRSGGHKLNYGNPKFPSNLNCVNKMDTGSVSWILCAETNLIFTSNLATETWYSFWMPRHSRCFILKLVVISLTCVNLIFWEWRWW